MIVTKRDIDAQQTSCQSKMLRELLRQLQAAHREEVQCWEVQCWVPRPAAAARAMDEHAAAHLLDIRFAMATDRARRRMGAR